MTDIPKVDHHPTPEQVARYLDGAATPAERKVTRGHLASCPECREEVAALSRLVPPRSGIRGLRAGLAAALAAAAALVLVLRPGAVPPPERSLHRDPAATAAPSIQAVAPIGVAGRFDTFVWTPLPGVARYRVTVFDAEGAILYRAATRDSAIPLPETLELSPARPYFWKIEGDTGWDRWVSSPLVEFSVEAGSPGK